VRAWLIISTKKYFRTVRFIRRSLLFVNDGIVLQLTLLVETSAGLNFQKSQLSFKLNPTARMPIFLRQEGQRDRIQTNRTGIAFRIYLSHYDRQEISKNYNAFWYVIDAI